MKPTITTHESMQAVRLMSRLITFFPADEASQKLIAASLAQFVAGPNELNWLVNLAVNVMHGWGGLSELRGLYCTKYRPLDEIEAVSNTPGYTPIALAQRAEKDFFENEQRESDRKLGEYRAEFRKLPPAEQQANSAVLIQARETELRRLN